MIAKIQVDQQILATKLYVPKCPAHLIKRERLIEKMNRTLACKLTVVSAPAGFGKSTLLSDWVEQIEAPVSWVSLDNGENDVIRFWSYVIAALQGIRPGVGTQASALLKSALNPSLENVIAVLVNDLVAIGDHFVLVLDDYHLIKAQEIHQSLHYFVQRSPVHMHICIASRTDIPFPLGSLRARDQINEIKMSELRFTSNEISAYWNQYVGVTLTKNDLQQLEFQTEGWIVGLQLAALSNKDSSSSSSFFSGHHRFVIEYLMEEVFQHLPERIQSFLLHTSILDRMNSSLCAAVSNTDEEEGLLLSLEQANLFLIPLDGEQEWYRYHHLFADFLRDRLKQQAPHQIVHLHAKASEWFEQNHDLIEAVDHAILAQNVTRAAALIERYVPIFLKRRELSILTRWLKQLPEEIVNQPNFLVIQTWTQLLLGNTMAMEQLWKRLEHVIAENHLLSQDEIARINKEMEIMKFFVALYKRDYEAACHLLTTMERLEEKSAEKNLFILNGVELSEGTSSVVRGLFGFYGRLKQAEGMHTLYADFIQRNSLGEYHFTAYIDAAWSELRYERNELDEAMKKGESARGIAYKTGNIGAFIPVILTLARIRWVRGLFEEAIAGIEEAMEIIHRLGEGQSYWHAILQAFLTRCYVAMGDHERVERWLQECQIRADREVTIYQDFENLTLLRVLLFQQKHQEAVEFSQRLLGAAEQEGWIGSILENTLLKSGILYQMGDIDQAVRKLHQALIIGEKEGYLRTILDERQILHGVLSKYIMLRKSRYIPELQSGVSLRYVEKLLSFMGEDVAKTESSKQLPSEMISPLTKRELEVLQLLALGLSNKEIAEKLFLTEGTTRIHLHRIYSKLNTSNRIQAIQKAKQLHLLP